MNWQTLRFIILGIIIFGLIQQSVTAQSDETAIDNASSEPVTLIENILDEEPVTELPTGKYIMISLADQMMWVIENQQVISRFKVSTGVPGHRTPTGKYSVKNHAVRAYSKKYSAWMLHWMGITSDGQYGIHALEGKSYLKHLGKVASHGCIRLSHDDAKWLYSWAESGTGVEIVADWEEPDYDEDAALIDNYTVYPYL